MPTARSCGYARSAFVPHYRDGLRGHSSCWRGRSFRGIDEKHTLDLTVTAVYWYWIVAIWVLLFPDHLYSAEDDVLMIEAEQVHHDKDTCGNFARWIGLLLAPVSWSVQLQTLWLTTRNMAVGTAISIWNHVVVAVALVCSIAGALIAWQVPSRGSHMTIKEKGNAERPASGSWGMSA